MVNITRSRLSDAPMLGTTSRSKDLCVLGVLGHMLLLIPLLPLVGFLLNASLGRRVSKTAAGAIACGVMLASFARVGRGGLATAGAAARVARDRADGLHVDHVRRFQRRLRASARSAVRADDSRRHRHRLADSHLLDRLHARRERLGVRPLLLVPESVCRVHARARARLELPGDVRRLGGRRPLLVPADRLLVSEEVGLGRRQESVHRQPHRRLRVHPRRLAGRSSASGRSTFRRWRALACPARTRDDVRHAVADHAAAVRRRDRQVGADSRSTSGCPTPWKGRRRCPR